MKYAYIASLLLAVVLLAVIGYGVSKTVPSEQLDAARTQCEKDKTALSASITEAVSKTSQVQVQLTECTGARSALQAQNTELRNENEQLKQQAAVLADARKKAETVAGYQLLLTYYNDAFGVGKVPSNAKLLKIDKQASALNDAAAVSSWNAVKNCQTQSECDNAKAAFVSYVNGKIASVSMEVVSIVGTQ